LKRYFRPFFLSILITIPSASSLARADGFIPFNPKWEMAQGDSFQSSPHVFTPTDTPCVRLDPKAGNALWLKLSAPDRKGDSVLFVRSMGRPFRLIQGENVLHKFAFAEGQPSRAFLGFPWHAVSLAAFDPSRPAWVVTPALKGKSGLCGEILIGPNTALAQKLGTDGLDRALISSFAWIAALMGLIAAWATRSFKPYLAFSGLSTSIAAWAFSSTSGPTIKQFIVSDPRFWAVLDLGGLYLTPALICLFYRQILSMNGWVDQTLALIQWGHIGFASLSLLGSLTGALSPAETIGYYNQIIPAFIVTLVALSVRYARSERTELRLFSLGTAVFMFFGTHDFLVGSGLVSWKRHLNHWGLLGMLASYLAVIWTRTRKEIAEKTDYQNAAQVNRKVAEKAKGAFHDLKTQIASLGAKIDALAEIPTERRDNMKANLTRMRAILNLQLERVESEQEVNLAPETHQPACSVGSVLNVLEEDYRERGNLNGVRVEFLHSDWTLKIFSPIVAIDLHRILANIIDNAIEASQVQDSVVLVSMDRAVSGIVISIRDFGPGISTTALEAFYAKRVHTTKPSGHGRGLRLARELTENAGGNLAIQSDTSGTTVLIHLPTCERPNWYFEVDPQSEGHFIALDDDDTIEEQLKRSLPRATVCRCTEESEFLTQARENPRAILLVDYSFGGTRNGLDLIRKEGLKDRAILFSGRVQFDQVLLASVIHENVRILPKEVLMLEGGKKHAKLVTRHRADLMNNPRNE
jgi:signal transduction histidine kinase